MAYIPKSKIAYKNTPEGQFIYKDTRQPFSGPYISVENKQFYVGVNFNKKGPELIRATSSNLDQGHIKLFSTHRDIREYNNNKLSIKNRLDKAEPIPVTKTIPTLNDYNKGFYTRYFTKRFNGESYIEIDKQTYNKLENESIQYDFNLYEWGSIVWHLTDNVFKKNALSIQKINRIFPKVYILFPILNEFFANNNTRVLEHQITDGGELYFSNGTEYKGLYHIHPQTGPMVGAKHSSSPHEKLYYTNQLPNIEGMDYNDFLLNYNKIKCYKCINQYGKFKKIVSSTRSSLLGCPPTTSSDLDKVERDCFGIEAPINDFRNRLLPSYNSHSSPDLKRVFPLDGGSPSFKDYSGFGLWNKNNKQYGEYNNENGTCFTPNTLVTMADGTKKMIAKIKKGDKVKSQVGESTVLEVITHTGSFNVYSINESKPFVTEEHPFKTIDGWKAINPITTLEKHQIQSKTLNLDDILIKLNGREIVKSIEKSKATYPNVYNLSLDNEHVYYANNYLVHNEKQVGLSIDDLEEMAYTNTNSYSWSERDVPNNNTPTGHQNPNNYASMNTVSSGNSSKGSSGGSSTPSSGGSSGGGGGGY